MIRTRSPLAGVVGALVVVEATSGVLQGYYSPLYSDIGRHLGVNDAHLNWPEAAQLLLSAIVVPLLARLGDMIGHRRVLLLSLAVTAAASWGLAFAPSFWLYIVAFAIQGFYVVWLPMNVSIIHIRARQHPNTAELTRKGAGLITAALQAGAIIGALAAGQLAAVFADSLWITLAVPAALVTAAFFVVLWRVPDTGVRTGGGLDAKGTALLSVSLMALTGGLALVRLDGITVWVVSMMAVGAVLMWWFIRVETRTEEPLIDMRLISRPTVWPVMLTAGLFGVSVLGAQVPLSTFAGTDPSKEGYGLGLEAASRSLLIGSYVISLLVGALAFAVFARRLVPRHVLTVAATLVAAGYLALVPFHASTAQVLTCMIVAGLGSGALVAALPATAAAAAPAHQTGVATGLTNTTKTLGGAFASAVFALALAHGVDAEATTAASLTGYQVVWAICGGTAILAVVALFTVPKQAFTHHDTDALGLAVDAAGGDAARGGSSSGPGGAS